ncbi:uncharacterized protein LOC143377918 [Andrena cerasifolii]|uniref:uncharacterized protein LOC143377918 n=1 Tax=Andrena cerasifolii TaxID=2819439 RepID=UPI004037BE1C
MTVHCMRNPMYALCLLAAVCVRQHVHNSSLTKLPIIPIPKASCFLYKFSVNFELWCSMLRTAGPLTKGVSFQAPTTLLTKPNEANLRTVINARTSRINSHLPTVKEADSLVSCVYKFTKRARRMVDDIRTSFPISKSPGCLDPTSTCSVLDSLLYLTSSVGTKWLA